MVGVIAMNGWRVFSTCLERFVFFGYVDLEAAYLVNLKSWWLYDLVVKENMFNVLSNRYIMV